MATLNATGFKAINQKVMDETAMNSAVRHNFYTQNNLEIRKILKNDLQMYMDGADINRMKLITLDYFIPAFLGKICNVYDTPPLYKTMEGGLLDDERFNEVMDEIKLVRKFTETFEMMRFNNTAISHVKYNEKLDRLFLDNTMQEWNTQVKPYDDFHNEWEILAYKVVSDRTQKDKYVVWDRELNQMYTLYVNKGYKIEWQEGEVRVKGEVVPLGDNEDLVAPDYSMGHPFVVYRYNDIAGNFWGNGIDSLVELVRSINVLLTVTNDDTIQESIRLLILNFSPTGTEGEKGQMKTGLRHPLFVEEGFSDIDPKGTIVSADLYNDDVMKLIDQLVSSVSSMHHIDNILKQNLEQSLSGVALRLKNEPMLRQWSADINLISNSDVELLGHIISVNNYHRPDRTIDESIIDNLQIDYQEPQVVTDIKEEYELEKAKWDDGTSSPVLYVMRKNPEMTEEDAKDYIRKNLDDMNELFQVSSKLVLDMPIETADDQPSTQASA